MIECLFNNGFILSDYSSLEYSKSKSIEICGRAFDIKYFVYVNKNIMDVFISDKVIDSVVYSYRENNIPNLAELIDLDTIVNEFIEQLKKYEWLFSDIDLHGYKYRMDDYGAICVYDGGGNDVYKISQDGRYFMVDLLHSLSGIMPNDALKLLTMIHIHTIKSDRKRGIDARLFD